MPSTAKVYSKLLGPLFAGRVNYDPCTRRPQLGDFGVIEKGEFIALVNLIEPAPDVIPFLAHANLPDLPRLTARPMQWKVEVPRERFQQGIAAVGATLHVDGPSELLSTGVPMPIDAPVTVTFREEKAATLSLENYERKVVSLGPVDEVRGREYLTRQNRDNILLAFRKDLRLRSFFVTQVELCYGYSNTCMRNAKRQQGFLVHRGLPGTVHGEAFEGCIPRSAKQDGAEEDKEWKYVFAYHGVQWRSYR